MRYGCRGRTLHSVRRTAAPRTMPITKSTKISSHRMSRHLRPSNVGTLARSFSNLTMLPAPPLEPVLSCPLSRVQQRDLAWRAEVSFRIRRISSVYVTHASEIF